MRESTISCHHYTEAASTEHSPQPRWYAAPSELSEWDSDALLWGIDDMSLLWFKFHVKFIHDPTIQKLSFVDQRHYIGLMCLKARGVMDRDITERMRVKLIRKALGISIDDLKRLKKQLTRLNLIENGWNPIDWEASQTGKYKENQIDPSEIPEMALKWHQNGTETVLKIGDNVLNPQDLMELMALNGHWNGTETALKRDRNSKNSPEINDIKAPRREEKRREDISNVHQGDGIHGKPTIKQEDIQTILRHLNDLTGSAFRWAGPSGRATKHAQLVRDVLRQGYTVAQCLSVIDAKARQWLTDDKMRQYLRPSTLFRLSKFETYLDEA